MRRIAAHRRRFTITEQRAEVRGHPPQLGGRLRDETGGKIRRMIAFQHIENIRRGTLVLDRLEIRFEGPELSIRVALA